MMLNIEEMNADPYLQFSEWFDEAVGAIDKDPEAMMLSTSDEEGRPSSRIVLLKSHSSEGFVFFTNYLSRKGRELENNPFAALLFFWRESGKQIRIEGRVDKLSEAHSDDYFNSRPAGSRAAAIASRQSEVIIDKSEFDKHWSTLGPEENLRRPDHWGGYILKPDVIEFWQAGEYRLNDRIRYRMEGDLWVMERLAP